MQTELGNGYIISDDKTLLQVQVIHDYLRYQSYWAKGIPMEAVQKSIEGSYCVGVYLDGGQVGFARLITDYATFGYLADVFILEAQRGKGLSKEIMKFLMEQEWVQGLRNTMLGTQDAHGLYQQFGFTLLTDPKRYMYIFKPNIYKHTK